MIVFRFDPIRLLCLGAFWSSPVKIWRPKYAWVKWSLSPRSSSPSRVLRAISSSDDDGSGYWRNQAKVDEWIDGEEKKEKEDAF
ncbi:hypothetical protein BHE74_00018687 [Ensete ventricosum]|nr:hypothetical protein GW17_00043867 [Ensete ventricosum]RWW73454.1 hypothetical protein BHE74_00018687 [Ensete ventricosum]